MARYKFDNNNNNYYYYYYLTRNISQTATDTTIVTIEGE